MRKITAHLATLLAVILALGAIAPAQAANSPALVPTFGTPQATAGGFAVQITNYDPAFTWAAITSNCGVAAVDSNGWVEVTGLDPSTTLTLTVFTERAGFDDGSAGVSGSSNSFFSATQLESGSTVSRLSNYETDANGNLFAALNRGFQNVLVVKSGDAGKTWSTLNTWTASTFTHQLSPQVTLGPNGRLAAIWQDGPPNVYSIKVSTTSDNGATWAEPVTLNTGQNSQWPAIKFTPDGELIVTWYVYDGVNFKVNSRQSSDDGATWSPMAAISNPSESSSQSLLLKSADGKIYSTWGVGEGIRARLYDHQNDTWGTIASINATGLDQFTVGAAVDRAGKLGLTWTQGTSTARSVWMTTFDGTTVATPVQVSTNIGQLSRPQLAFTQTHVTVTWRSGADFAPVSAITRTAQLSDLSWGTQRTLATGAWEIYQLGLAAIGGSTFALRWLRDSDGIHYLLEQSISTDNGANWGAVEIVSNELENSYDPVSLVTSNNEYSLMWRVQNGSPDPFFLKVARYEPSITLPQKELYLAAEMEAGPVGSGPYSAVTYNGKLYYSASTAATGRELFSFDGTNVELVADLNPGSGDGLYSSGGVIGVFNNKLFLKGDDGTTGFELYAYDGTNIELIADVVPGPTSSMAYMPDNLVYFDDLLFFSGRALDVSEGRGYVYDFATDTFSDMRDHFPDYTKRNFWDPVVFQGSLYFRATEPGQPTRLVKYDGSNFTDFPTGGNNVARGLVVFGDKIVYRERDADGIELWSFDGTTASKVADLNPGSADSFPSTGKVLGGRYYFTAQTPDATSGQTDNELWVWDGVTAPTKRHDFFPNNPSASSSTWGWPSPIFASTNGNLYFSATDATHGTEFREFSPCQAEPTLAADLVAGSQGSDNPQAIGELNGTIYVGLASTDTGVELYAYGVKPAGFQASVFMPDYTITYNPNGGTGSAAATLPAGSVTLSDGTGFEKPDKVLLGWDTSSTATTPTYERSDSFLLSANVTLFAIWGDPPVIQTPGTNPAPNPDAPKLDFPTGPKQAASGGEVEIEGDNLDRVNKAEVGSKDAEIKTKTETSLTLGLPSLEPGLHDLKLTSDFGSITIQGAIRVTTGFRGITPEAQSTINAWTKANDSKTEVRMYARGLVGAGKVQFFVDGVEIAWVRATSQSDPRLRVLAQTGPMAGVPYLIRTVALNPGKNRFEIRVDGQRVWRATYTLQR